MRSLSSVSRAIFRCFGHFFTVSGTFFEFMTYNLTFGHFCHFQRGAGSDAVGPPTFRHFERGFKQLLRLFSTVSGTFSLFEAIISLIEAIFMFYNHSRGGIHDA